MPRRGGSSTNAGIHYQAWYLALQISNAFFNPSIEIYPEALKGKNQVFIDDVVLKVRSQHTYYSLKLKAPSKYIKWNETALGKESILQDFKEQFEADSDGKINLISETPCPMFAEVFKRAAGAIGEIDIEERIGDNEYYSQWIKIMETLEYDFETMISFSQKVFHTTYPLSDMKIHVANQFQYRTDYNGINYFLLDKALEASSWKTTVNKKVINQWFLEEGITFKK